MLGPRGRITQGVFPPAHEIVGQDGGDHIEIAVAVDVPGQNSFRTVDRGCDRLGRVESDFGCVTLGARDQKWEKEE